ncbi:MAG: hypothetical protein Sv326_0577 [Candidatus Fermentimicrarchaeum limneticum]|uniref:Uncharacterized protein n=1 Tax=Fermentimicrarchaeum limneticum TaxID=2795018 RepID=A0A7D5XHF0_FERL1|nr:MAG: hypothetical protein Sv326_0577 [Candidatus Fermentimicrarchaeum limneticum]
MNINISSFTYTNMARRKEKKKTELDLRFVLIGVVSGMFAMFGMMCIPCIVAANPSIALFLTVLGAISILLAKNSWLFILVGVILLAVGITFQFLAGRNKCG